jgi:enolase-phosphatase E1
MDRESTLLQPVECVVMDIEGTTSAIPFVTGTLYPYARDRMPDFIRRRRGEAEVAAIMDAVRELAGVWNDEAVVVQLCQWMDADRKAAPLKTLQGLIWEEGYRNGDLVSHLYPDVLPVLRDWHDRGVRLYIYSSGSVLAQRLIFAHTVAGDLTPMLAGFFDTRVGHKRASASYRRIAAEIATQAPRIIFLSDVREELDAARGAGWQTVWLVREGAPPLSAAHRRATRFDQIRL